MFSSIGMAFGHPAECRLSLKDNLADPAHLIASSSNLLGYFPIACTIIGLTRLVFFSMLLNGESDLEQRKFYATQVTRGVIECLWCGVLFLIPDLIFTIGRFVHVHREQRQNRFT